MNIFTHFCTEVVIVTLIFITRYALLIIYVTSGTCNKTKKEVKNFIPLITSFPFIRFRLYNPEKSQYKT